MQLQAILNITDGEFGAVLTKGEHWLSCKYVNCATSLQGSGVYWCASALEARVILVCWCEHVKVKVN